MRILVLGGTKFVGRHFTDAALAAGHEVTHFNRGQSGTPAAGVQTIIGDRTQSLDALSEGSWEWVLDTCGFLPRIVRMSAQFLKDRVLRYAFVSTISVYTDFSRPVTEDSELAKLDDESVEEITGETYGGLKVLCEKAVLDSFGDNSLIVRPGMIVGPYDPTDRFTYWVWRAAQPSHMVAPGNADLPMQFIDARDLGNWMLRQMETETTGTFNVSGEQTTLGTVLSGADVRYLPGSMFRESGIEPDSVFAWYTEGKEDERYTWDVDITRAKAARLALRSIPDTVRDTVKWALSRSAEHAWRAGLKPTDEERLLNLTLLG